MVAYFWISSILGTITLTAWVGGMLWIRRNGHAV